MLALWGHWILTCENCSSEVLLPRHLLSNHVAGILSVFCAQAGASLVYAVEASALASIIPKVAEENNFSEVIKVCSARNQSC
jgi:hypothetical protein